MDKESCLTSLRKHIAFTEVVHTERWYRQDLGQREAVRLPVSADYGDDKDAPPLPPPLPWPEFEVAPGLIPTNDAHLGFFLAFQQGDRKAAEEFLEAYNPSHAVRQFALEEASFGGQPEVIKLLLASGALLHKNIFERFTPRPDSTEFLDRVHAYLFVQHEVTESSVERLLEITQAFLDHGWHPNQGWNHPVSGNARFPLLYPSAITNRPLLVALLLHGADPNLGSPETFRAYDRRLLPPNRRCGEVLNRAAEHFDIGAVVLLLSCGANPQYAHTLDGVAQWQGGGMVPYEPGEYRGNGLGRGPLTPWALRRPMAEYLVYNQIADVNEVKRYEPMTSCS